MEILKTEGIVLRLHPVTETSLIVTWLTKDHGKLRTMAKGARRPKSPFRGRVEPFYRDEVLFLRSGRSDLHILHECTLLQSHRPLREELAKLNTALYFAELTDLATEPEHAEPDLYELLKATLEFLAGHPLPPLLAHHFEINLLAAVGHDPSRMPHRLPPDLVKLTERLRELKPGELSRLKITPAQSEALEALFLSQAEVHFGRLPRSRRFVQ